MKRIEAGGAIHVETWLLSKIFGRPEIRVEVTKPDPAKAQLLGQLRALSKAERMQLAELARKAIAGATFGSSPSGGGPSAVLPAVSPVTGKPLPALPAVPATPVDRAGATSSDDFSPPAMGDVGSGAPDAPGDDLLAGAEVVIRLADRAKRPRRRGANVTPPSELPEPKLVSPNSEGTVSFSCPKCGSGGCAYDEAEARMFFRRHWFDCHVPKAAGPQRRGLWQPSW